jgi:hypothetical protein
MASERKTAFLGQSLFDHQSDFAGIEAHGLATGGFQVFGGHLGRVFLQAGFFREIGFEGL